MRKKSEVKLKRTLDVAAAQKLLTDLAESIKDGTVCVEALDEFAAVTVGSEMELELSVSEKKSKQRLSIEFSWRLPEPEDEMEPFRVSSSEPEITEPSPVEEESAEEEEA